MKKFLLMATVACAAASCGGNKAASNTDSQMNTDTTSVTVDIETSMGPVEILLYGDTPLHRDNFLKLAREGYYDGVLFHRVIKDFMVQTGDPDSRNAVPGQPLGQGDPGYTIPAEMVYPKHFHRRGALAAARTGDEVNPERRSSGSQFYFVTGKVYNDSTLAQYERQLRMQRTQEIFNRMIDEQRDNIMALRRNRDKIALQQLQEDLVDAAQREAAGLTIFTDEQRAAYTTVGGTPHLDGAYTVFGEVTKGMEVIDAIQQVQTGAMDRPVEDIRILKVNVRE